MLDANMSGLESYIGGLGGIIKAVESTSVQDDFSGATMKYLKKKFMADTIASNLAGNSRIQHAFEWPAQDGRGVSTHEASGIPLFKLKINGQNGFKIMSFDFLPSMRSVPLPDPDFYGFKEEKLQHLRRHVFTMKAAVMENSPSVMIAPRMSKKLFIPAAGTKYGYYMTDRPQNINPGGAQATGGFAEWWNAWFATSATPHVEFMAKLMEETIAKTSQKVFRYAAGTVINGKKVGGQFATRSAGTTQRVTTVGAYVDGARRSAEVQMKQAAKFVFDDDEWEGDE